MNDNKLHEVFFTEEAKEDAESLLAEWFIEAGSTVTKHQPLCEVSTDKALVEVASPCDGVVTKLCVQPNDVVKPGTKLCLIDEKPIDSSLKETTNNNTPKTTLEAKTTQPSAQTDNIATETSDKEHRAIKRYANEHGIDLRQISGSGANGRVTLRDLQEMTPKVVSEYTAKDKLPPVTGRLSTHSAAKLQVAKAMSQSLLEVAPHVTAVFEIDLRKIIAHRKSLNTDRTKRNLVKVTLNSYFLLAAAKAVTKVPEVNSRWRPEGLEIFDHIHFGIGVKTEGHGLVLPVLKNVENLSLEDIAEQSEVLFEKARTNELEPHHMQGATLSISNHGGMGSLLATPIIIPQPQSAIIGVGALEDRVKAVDGEIVIIPSLYLTLTIDHRVLNASHTNAFLSEMKSILESWPSSHYS